MALNGQVRARRSCQGSSFYGQGCPHRCFMNVYLTQLVGLLLFVMIIIVNSAHIPTDT